MSNKRPNADAKQAGGSAKKKANTTAKIIETAKRRVRKGGAVSKKTTTASKRMKQRVKKALQVLNQYFEDEDDDDDDDDEDEDDEDDDDDDDACSLIQKALRVNTNKGGQTERFRKYLQLATERDTENTYTDTIIRALKVFKCNSSGPAKAILKEAFECDI